MLGRQYKFKILIIVLAVLVLVETLFLLWLWRAPKPLPFKPAAIAKGKIAIVLDDWGYNLNSISIIKGLPYPLTLSVLPNLPYSASVAQEAKQKGLEVILHLPMEPREKYPLEKDTIFTSLNEADIRMILVQDLTSIGYVHGVSNHMGSKATTDVKTMSAVFRELKKRRLYFLDSFVASDSVCLELARKMGLGFAKRDIFIDNKSDPGYIRGQLYKLRSRARMYGQAVGIGHDRRSTLDVLKEIMPQFEKEGYKFVFVSEIVR